MPEPQDLALNFALKSHPGRIRPLNEDAVGADPGIGLFILADGLGGYNAGEVASTMTVSMLLTDLGVQLTRANGSPQTFDPTDALVAIRSTPLDDLYVVLGSTSADGSGRGYETPEAFCSGMCT